MTRFILISSLLAAVLIVAGILQTKANIVMAMLN